jgi:hypothetical protein
MIFTNEFLSKLESSTALKKKYAAQGSLGQNRLVALPVVIGFIAAFGAYTFQDMSKTDPGYHTYLIVCLVVILLCILAVVMIQANAKKQVLNSLDDVKICLAKKIAGNDATGAYYSIYTVGAKRHDADFVEAVADKILNIEEEPNGKIRAQIDNLFREDFEGINVTPVLLPVEFTYGEEVYRKEFKLSQLNIDMKQNVIENNDKFIAICYHNRSVLPLQSLR